MITITVTCDIPDCYEYTEIEAENADEARESARMEGWVTKEEEPKEVCPKDAQARGLTNDDEEDEEVDAMSAGGSDGGGG